MKWWKIAKVALKVGMRVGRVKEKARVDEFVQAIDEVVKEATKVGKAEKKAIDQR